MKLLITCGGTGGHIYPALAVAAEFPQEQVCFVGTQDKMENTLIPQSGYAFHGITTHRSHPLKILRGFFQAIKILVTYKPTCVLSTGGWVTLPVCLAAVLLRIPIVLQEQNTIPGKVNRLIGFWAKKIALGFPIKGEYFNPNKILITGNPIRPEFTTSAPLPPDLIPRQSQRKILIIGGSQGAQSINRAITEIFIRSIMPDMTFTLITGHKTFKDNVSLLSQHQIQPDYTQQTLSHYMNGTNELFMLRYTDQIPALMNAANMVIARAGASTLSELAALGKPSILIPYPFAADDHQYWNAQLFTQANAAVLVNNDELSPDCLTDIMTSLFSKSDLLSSMGDNARQLHHTRAAGTIANLIKDTFTS